MTHKKKESKPLPSMEELNTYMAQQTHKTNKREIARKFGIKGGESRAELKRMLRTMKDEGTVQTSNKGRSVFAKGVLPAQLIIEITGLDSMGDLVARPFKWMESGPAPQIIVTKDKLSPPAGVGDVVQARIKNVGNKMYEAEATRRVASGENHMVGVYKGGMVSSVDRRLRDVFTVNNLPADIKENDIVIVDIPSIRSMHPEAEFVRKIGSENDAFAPTLIAIYLNNIPVAFTEASEKQAQKAIVPQVDKHREDLRHIPFVTIDGADAKDFDDAVFAEPDTDAGNAGGYHVMVGIADVAHYVTPGSPLDIDAKIRGNSVYFPDRVIPMLPFELSAGLCSLQPDQPRGTMVCEAWLDKTGKKIRHKFIRGLMKSKRRLTYDEVQAALDGKQPIVGMEEEIKNLNAVYRLLLNQRAKRGVLEIDVPERQVILNEKGQVIDIKLRTQLDAHKLIEEMMIMANVSAAETLEDQGFPAMYRIHDRPSDAKVETLNDFLDSLGMKIHMSATSQPRDFNEILTKSQGSPKDMAVNEFVLRSQSQAVYSPENVGHFGLALQHYAHFTSPIRRYADLLVHRGLIKALKLGDGGTTDAEMDAFEDTARHISYTERQAASAEQDAKDRYTAMFLHDQIGNKFTARISSATAFGLFVSLDQYGADGLIPIRSLGGDYYEYDDKAQRLVGRDTGVEYTVGDIIEVVLKECVPITGGMIFELANRKGNWSSERGPRHVHAKKDKGPREFRPNRGGGGGEWRSSKRNEGGHAAPRRNEGGWKKSNKFRKKSSGYSHANSGFGGEGNPRSSQGKGGFGKGPYKKDWHNKNRRNDRNARNDRGSYSNRGNQDGGDRSTHGSDNRREKTLHYNSRGSRRGRQ